MKFKYAFLLIVFIICSCLSTAMAMDVNQTATDPSNVLIEDNDYLTLDGGEDNDISLDEPTYSNSDIATSESYKTDKNSDSSNTTTINSYLSPGNENISSYAIVDFGSNSISLIIYDYKNGKLNSKFTKSEVSVVSTYTENNRLTTKGIDRLIDIFNDFERIMNEEKVKSKYYFATASLRNIENGDEVISLIKDKLGITINIITGQEEAIYGFNAVKNIDLTTDNGILIDLGGGSCEVTYFVNKTIVMSKSRPIGSSSAFKEYVSSIIPDETEKLKIKKWVKNELDQLNAHGIGRVTDLYCLGGTLYTFKQILSSMNNIDNETQAISVSKFDQVLDNFMKNPMEAYQNITRVDENRGNTLVPGLIITQAIMDYFDIEKLHFCKARLEDGIVYELIENETLPDSKENPSVINVITDNGDLKLVGYSIRNTPITDNNVIMVEESLKDDVDESLEGDVEENNNMADGDANLISNPETSLVNNYLPALLVLLAVIVIVPGYMLRKK